MSDESKAVVRCDACPVLCRIRDGKAGACDRYANVAGVLTRLDPLLVAQRAKTLVPFLEGSEKWQGDIVSGADKFVTGVGAGPTPPD